MGIWLNVARETMTIEYVNRKSQTYYLHQGTTKTGKPRYFFSQKTEGNLASEIPDGYEIYENLYNQILCFRFLYFYSFYHFLRILWRLFSNIQHFWGFPFIVLTIFASAIDWDTNYRSCSICWTTRLNSSKSRWDSGVSEAMVMID